MGDFIQEHVLSLQHWPFMVMSGVFWVIGHFMEKSVFTKARAYAKGKLQWLWWWGRESMELHPVLAGAVLGMLWVDPEGLEWGTVASMGYFAGSGLFSLFFWKVISIALKRFGGGELTLPGESQPPDK